MREANFSSLRLMAHLVDPELSAKLSSGWTAFLDSQLGQRAGFIRGLKPLREVVLGGLERAWFRRQSDLQKLEAAPPEVKGLSGLGFLQCAFGDEPHSYSAEVQAACSKIFKQMRGRISSAYTAVEHAMVERIAQALLQLPNASFFCRNADEVMFALDTTCPAESERVALDASNLLRTAFSDGHQELGNLFRVEVFLALDLGKECASGGASTSLVKLTKRLLPTGDFESFAALKGVPREFAEHHLTHISKKVRELRLANAAEWSAWLNTSL